MLTKLLGSRIRAKVLAWLLSHTDERYFVRQLASLVHEDATNVSREVKRLSELGILTRAKEGQQTYFQANPACPVYVELRGLVLKTQGAADVIRDALLPLGERVKAAFLYGSAARCELTKGSDIDLLVIGDVTLSEIVSALSDAQDRLAREINPTVYPPTEFAQKASARHHFVSSVLADEKILLIGDDDELERLAE